MASCDRGELNPAQKADAQTNAQDRLRALAVEELASAATKNFAGLDSDQDGFLSAPEVINPVLTAQQQSALGKNLGKIGALIDEGTGSAGKGASIDDLKSLTEHSYTMPPARSMVRDVKETLIRTLDKISADPNISKQELETALGVKTFSACDKEAFQNALDHFEKITGRNSTDITATKLNQWLQGVRTDTTLIATIGRDLGK